MSEAYEDDMAAERAILDRVAAVEAAEQRDLGAAPPTERSTGGRPSKVDPIKLVAWRQAHKATVAQTAKHWKVSEPTVKRLSREYGEAAKAERQRFEHERLDQELSAQENSLLMMFYGQRNRHLDWVSQRWFGATEAARGTPDEATVEAAREAALEEADREFREDWERTMGWLPETLKNL